jgi:type II restriction enzyme
MATKGQLAKQRLNQIINEKSKEEEKQCLRAVARVLASIEEQGVQCEWEKNLHLKDVEACLKESFPDEEFGGIVKTKRGGWMMPDGGILYIVDKSGKRYPILISEVKNQGTNDARLAEGKDKQAQGNAIERLGKNVIGLRAYMLNEKIFPFVCFGDGCDFAEGSSILNRVVTIALFGKLNVNNTCNSGPNGIFNRGSFYFREEKWTEDEVYTRMLEVAVTAVEYYFKKYGKENFV